MVKGSKEKYLLGALQNLLLYVGEGKEVAPPIVKTLLHSPVTRKSKTMVVKRPPKRKVHDLISNKLLWTSPAAMAVDTYPRNLG